MRVQLHVAGKRGPVTYVYARSDQNIRVKPENEPLGALGDLGWYTVRFALWAFNYEIPHSVQCFFNETTNGVPTDCSGNIMYASSHQSQSILSACAVQ